MHLASAVARAPPAGRTLWFIGDSQTWHSYYSAECFLRSYAVDFVRRPATNSSEGEAPLRPVTWPIVVASMCIHLRDDTRICNVRRSAYALDPSREMYDVR